MERAELEKLVTASGVAERRGEFVFLCDPHWTSAQRGEFERIVQQSKIENPKSKIQTGWLCVPTGGSGGGLRFARHDEQTLSVAVEGFCAHFDARQINAVGVLPLHHVSGLMAAVRCAATGGQYLPWSWKQLEAGELPERLVDGGEWFLSLVPTQLQRLLGAAKTVDWLRRFRTIFVGGGPGWPELAERAADAKVPVAFSYGMTETAAMVAAQTAMEFSAGRRSSGRAMPHARIEIVDEASGALVPGGMAGVIRIAGGSVFRGYFPEERASRSFETGDFGRWDETGGLHVLGRRDAVIITGGKKVHPAEVEAALHATGLFPDVVVMGVVDPEWGEVVVAYYPAQGGNTAAVELTGLKLEGLAPYQRPKRLVAVADWPRNAQGKINRAALKAAVSALGNPRG